MPDPAPGVHIPIIERRDHRRLDEQSPASFELAHVARHVGEIDHLEEAHAPAQ
jgi:hypothetical protein